MDSGGAPPGTVFLHPIGLDAGCWDLFAASSGSAVAINLVGHGGRPRVPGTIKLSDLVDDVAASLDRPSHLVGVSLGGIVSLNLALCYPELVLSLVVAATSPATRPEVMLSRAERVRRLGMPGTLNETLERWFTAAALRDSSHPGVAYVRRTLLQNDSQTIAAIWTAMAAHDVRSELRNIRVPITIILGSEDTAVATTAWAPVIPTLALARLEVIPAAHMLHLERPAEFRGALSNHWLWLRDRGHPPDH